MIRTDKAASGGYLVTKQTKALSASHRKPNDPAKIKAEKPKVMTAKQWENSATQGESLNVYEGSALDEKNDKKQLAAHNKAARKGK